MLQLLQYIMSQFGGQIPPQLLQALFGYQAGGTGSGLAPVGLGALFEALGLDPYGNALTTGLGNQQWAMNLLKNPAATQAFLKANTAPLNKQLVQSVGQDVNANTAARGLNTSPGVSKSIFAEALAPYEQQNQQNAISLLDTAVAAPFQENQLLGYPDPYTQFLATI